MALISILKMLDVVELHYIIYAETFLEILIIQVKRLH